MASILIHEIMHIMLKHCVALSRRIYDHDIVTAAMDLSINCLLEEARYCLPGDAFVPGRQFTPFAGLRKYLSVDLEYYELLKNNPPEGNDNKAPKKEQELFFADGMTEDDGGAPESMYQSSSEDWGRTGGASEDGEAEAVREGMAERLSAKALAGQRSSLKAGRISANLLRLIEESRCHNKDYKAFILNFATERRPLRLDWARPNRRHLANGVFLPSITGKAAGEIAIVFDLSGSITKEVGDIFWGICLEIALMPEISKLILLCHDVEVTSCERVGFRE